MRESALHSKTRQAGLELPTTGFPDQKQHRCNGNNTFITESQQYTVKDATHRILLSQQETFKDASSRIFLSQQETV